MIRTSTIIALLATCLLCGCAHTRGGAGDGRIEAPHSHGELEALLVHTEGALGLPLIGSVRVRLPEGTIDHASGWRHGASPDGVSVWGFFQPPRYVTIFTTDRAFQLNTAIHELAHAVLFSNGIPLEQHHAIMREAGIR
jgi:hypothetical protein